MADEDDDEWVEEKEDKKILTNVKKSTDPAEVVEINARTFKVTERYVDTIIQTIKDKCIRKQDLKDDTDTSDLIVLSDQDRELLYEAVETFNSNKPSIKEGIMRVASILICDLIERLNLFGDNVEEEKKGVLVFLPGLHEIFEFIEFIKDFYPS